MGGKRVLKLSSYQSLSWWFLCGWSARSSTCADCLAIFQSMASEFGVPLTVEKTPNKLLTLRQLLEIMGKKKCTLKEIQSVLGHLNYVCRVVSPEWAFCAWLAHATVGVRKPCNCIWICKGYVRIWQFGWNSWITLMGSLSGRHLQVYSDAAGSLEFGLLYNRWSAQLWPREWVGSDFLQVLDFFWVSPIMVAICLWQD